MLQYPSIPSGTDPKTIRACKDKPCIAFVKYDGSNLRWEWSPKAGWSKFGTRKQLFDQSSPLFNQAIPLFMDTMASELEYRGKQLGGKKLERMTAFTEFFGPSSFAGQHEHDEPKELRLFDLFLFKKGFVTPQQFVELFGKLPYSAEVVYKGPFSEELCSDVRHGRLVDGEGVVCKGTAEDFTVKVKTQAWYTKLKARYVNWEALA